MPDPSLLLAQAPTDPSPYASLILMAVIFGIFYVVLILPMRNKQKKLEELVKKLKAGDKVVLNAGIFGTIVAVEDDAFLVRIDHQTRVKVLKSAVAGLQGQGAETAEKTEKK